MLVTGNCFAGHKFYLCKLTLQTINNIVVNVKFTRSFFVALSLVAFVNLALHYSVHSEYDSSDFQSLSDCQFCQTYDPSLTSQLPNICVAKPTCALSLYIAVNVYTQTLLSFQARAPPEQLIV